MGSPKESLEQKNVFTEKYDEIRRLDGTGFRTYSFFKLLRGPGIDSWRAGTTNKVVIPARLAT
jgi:hypothetical protein